MTTYLTTDEVRIEIPGAADLAHGRSWLMCHFDTFDILPMHPDVNQFPNITANYGAGFSLIVPTTFMLACFSRAETRYQLDGNSAGSMSETHNAWARDGDNSHNVEQFTLDWWVDKANGSYGFRIDGILTPRPETFSSWPPYRRIREFSVSATLPLFEASRLFLGDNMAHEKIELALQQLG